jgi:hypothetical protein
MSPEYDEPFAVVEPDPEPDPEPEPDPDPEPDPEPVPGWVPAAWLVPATSGPTMLVAVAWELVEVW